MASLTSKKKNNTTHYANNTSNSKMKPIIWDNRKKLRVGYLKFAIVQKDLLHTVFH